MKSLWNIYTKTSLLILLTTVPFLYLLVNMPWEIWGEDFFWVIFAFHVASVLGYIGTVLICWEFILGTRPVSSFFTPNILALNTIHRYIGAFGIIFILSHPLLEIYTYGRSFFSLFQLNFGTEMMMHVTFGRIAFLLFLFIWLTSALARGSIAYRPWKYIHYLTYPLMAMVLLHMKDIGTNLQRYPLLGALWYCAAIGFALLVLTRILQTTWVITNKHTISNIQPLSAEITAYTFKPLSEQLDPAVGQFIYIQTARFGESHPFSVMEYNKETGEITIGVKTVGVFSESLKGIDPGAIISLEGPFGVFTKEGQNSEPKVVIAGGAGVTPFIELAKQHGRRTIFLNCNKTLDDVIFRPLLIETFGSSYYDFITRDTCPSSDEHVIEERISSEHIQKILQHHGYTNPRFFVCGSPRFTEGVENILQNQLKIPKSRLFFEKFSM